MFFLCTVWPCLAASCVYDSAILLCHSYGTRLVTGSVSSSVFDKGSLVIVVRYSLFILY